VKLALAQLAIEGGGAQDNRERGFETPAADGYANTAVFVDGGSHRRAVYRKRHLFGYGSAEQELLEPGESTATVEFEDGTLLGRSTVYDPWGTAVAGTGETAGLVTTRIDPDTVADYREEFPALADRRL